MTISEARALLERDRSHQADLGVVSDELFLDWANVVDGAYYRQARRVNPLGFRAVLTTSVTPQAPETVIADLDTLRGEGCGVFETNEHGTQTDRKLPVTHPGSEQTGYYYHTATSTLVITGGPTATYVVGYIPRRTELTAMSDTLLIPGEYREAILRSFRRAQDVWEAGETLQLQDTLLVRALQDVFDNLLPQPTGGLMTNHTLY